MSKSMTISKEMQEHWLYPKNRMFTKYEAWLDILMDVNEEGKSFKSSTQWAKRWDWSVSKVRRFLQSINGSLINLPLKPIHNPQNEQVNEQVKNRLIVLNYDTYRDGQMESEQVDEQVNKPINQSSLHLKHEKEMPNLSRSRDELFAAMKN